jgi:VanZ family protein
MPRRPVLTAIMSVVNDKDDVSQAVKQPKPSRRVWFLAIGAWVALILFSSTSVAAEYCNRAFDSIYDAIFGTHHASDSAFSWLHFLAEKGLHLTLFLVLGILLWQVIMAPRGRRLAAVVLLGLMVGTASELLQAFFPDRDPAIRDVLLNVVGTFLGAAARARRG